MPLHVAPKFRMGQEVQFDYRGSCVSGVVGIIDYRGSERASFMGSSWSYDVWIDSPPPVYDGVTGPILHKHLPECWLRDAADSRHLYVQEDGFH